MTEGGSTSASGSSRTEDLFDVVFRMSADAMIVTRIKDGAYLAINDAFLRMSRRTREEVLAGNAVDLDWADPADREVMVRELREKGSAGPNRATFRDVDGEPRYGSYSSVVIDFQGVPAVLTSIRDLTDLHDVELTLRDQGAKLQMLSDNMPGFTWTTDRDLIVTSSAGAGSPAMDTTPADFVGRDLRKILSADLERVSVLQRVLNEGATERHEADWSGRIWDIYLAPLRVGDDIVGVSGAAIDITSRRQMEEATRRYAERLHALNELEHGIRSALTAKEISTQACERTRNMVGCARASVVGFDFEAQTVAGVVVSTKESTAIHTDSVMPLEVITHLDALHRGETLHWDDLSSADDLPADLAIFRDEGLRSYLRLPLLVEGELIGAMNLGSTEVAGFSDSDIEIATEIAGSVAVALRQARLHEQVRSYAAELESTIDELRTAQSERRKLLSRLVAVQEEERQTIAADIHDDSLQKMAAVGLRLDVLRRKLTDPASAEEAHRLAELVNLTIDRLRHLMFELWPASLERHGLEPAVRVELLKLRDETGMAISLEDHSTATLPVELGTIAYRICREAITNARLHSGASRVEVTFGDLEGGLLAKIRDDGVGLTPESLYNPVPGHLGLSAMLERADLAGGWLKIHSPVEGSGTGTEVEFWLPVEPETDARATRGEG